ncbi:MAG: hypothetical protein AAGG01_15130, partial [Planctomycetota bacterium]
MKRLLLPIAFGAAVVIALVLFREKGASAPEGTLTAAPALQEGTGLATNAEETLLDVASAPDAAEAEDQGRRSVAAGVVGEFGADASDAVEVRGRVKARDGGGLGEPLALMLRSPGAPESSTISVEVSKEGAFTLPGNLSWPLDLVLDAQFLALEGATAVERPGPGEELTLTARRGGCVEVLLVGPAAGAEDARLGDSFEVAGTEEESDRVRRIAPRSIG